MTSVTPKVSDSIGITNQYICEICDYKTNVKSNYTKHCLTARHKTVTIGDINVSNVTTKYSCSICSKVYNSRNGLWCHSKKCSLDGSLNRIVPAPEGVQVKTGGECPAIDTTLIMNLLKENQEFKALLFEQSKQVLDLQAKQSEIILEFQKENSILMNKLVEREPGNNTINSNNTTNNNHQKFNLNFFLNETCKDAMNIQEFLENLVVTFQDLLTIGDSGFVTGVSDILIKQLRDLEVSKRPIHCTDAKRETIYVKDQDTWNKDDKENTKLKNILQKVEYKNVVSLRDWCNENPDAKVNNTTNNILKDKIYLQTLQGDDRTRNKIIKNLTKEIIVDKVPTPSSIEDGDDDDV